MDQPKDVERMAWACHEREQRRRERASTTLMDRLRWLEDMSGFAQELSARARNRRQAAQTANGSPST